MLKYEMKIKSQGTITVIPDSQRLFGFLINKLKKYLGESSITKLVMDVKSGEEMCMMSSLMPSGYVPTPKNYMLDSIGSEQDRKEVYKSLKKRDYIKYEALVEFKDKGSDMYMEKYLTKTRTFQQKFNLKSQSLNLDGYPNQAYTVPIIRIGNGTIREVKNFSFFVTVDEKSKMQEGLDLLDSNLRQCGTMDCVLGPKGSYGYNCYEIQSIEKGACDFKFGKGKYLNLGMLLPNEEVINWEDSYLEIYTSDRNSYDIYNEKKKVISFIKEGSVIDVANYAEFDCIGKSIANPYNLLYRDAIVFGNSYFIGL